MVYVRKESQATRLGSLCIIRQVSQHPTLGAVFFFFFFCGETNPVRRGPALIFREQGHFIEKLDLDGEPKNAPSFDVLLLKMTDELVRKEDPNIQRQVDNARVRRVIYCLGVYFLSIHR